MHICILTAKYPSEVDQAALVFVQQLAWTMADQGVKVSVICPIGINRNKKNRLLPVHLVEKSYEGNDIDVFFPKFLDCGQTNVLWFNTACFTTFLFYRTVDTVIKNMKTKPDVFYGHFITPSGVTASILGKKYGLPSFAAYGESTPWTIYQLGIKKTKKILRSIDGIISVSTANKNELQEIGIVSGEKIEVFPNGYRSARFSPRDKAKAREHFGLPENKFIVCFVGHFIKRKGIQILNSAVDNIDDTYLICAGKGELKPQGDRVLYANPVDPENLAEFYSAADVFCLPTVNEGCCNAIIEAMACGLPIISSNLPFNDDILNDENSIRINPLNCEEVENAISKLKNDILLRKKMSDASLTMAKKLTLEKRTRNILSFIERRIK